MNTLKTAVAATVLSALSFGVFAAAPAHNTASDMTKPAAAFHDVEAGSNIQKGASSTGRSMDDAFDAHTLVAGEWY